MEKSNIWVLVMNEGPQIGVGGKVGLFIMISGRRILDSQHGIIFSAAREIGKCEIAPSSLALCPKGALFISGGRKESKERRCE